MKKKLPLIFVLILTAIMVGAILKQTGKTSGNSNSGIWKTYQSKEFSFIMNYPSQWAPKAETANVSFAAPKKEGDPFAPYVRVTKNFSGEDFDAVGTFNKIYEAKPNTKIENPNQGDIVIDATVTKVENLEVDGQKAAKVLEESKVPGPFYAERIYTLRDNQVWVISNVAPTKEELDEQKPLFAKALTTFKFLSK